MSTTSITQAVIDKYEALTASNFPGSSRPRIDFGSAAQVVSGVQLRPPYVTLKDEGREVKVLDFEGNKLVTTQFSLEVYAATAADVDTVVTAIRLNGGTVAQGLGFDLGSLSTLTTPKSTHQILPTAEPRFLAPQTDRDGNRIHGAKLSYKVCVLESA